MKSSAALVVHNASVVLTAQSHNPSILNPDFLKRNKIVGEDWEVKETITTPALSQTKFSNGITWLVDESRCAITQTIRDIFRNNYLVHSLAVNYVNVLPHISYRAVGLNWSFHLPKKNSKSWLKKKFIKEGNWQSNELPINSVDLKFAIGVKDDICFFKIRSDIIHFPEQDKVEAIVADANYHFDGPFDDIGIIIDIIQNWELRQKHLKRLAIKYFFGGAR